MENIPRYNLNHNIRVKKIGSKMDKFIRGLEYIKIDQMKFLKLRYKNEIKNTVGWTKLKVRLLNWNIS